MAGFLQALKGSSASAPTPFMQALATAPPPPKAPIAAPQGPNWGTWGNAAAVTAVRPAINALTALPLMGMDAGVATRNLVGDEYHKLMGDKPTQDYTMPSKMWDRALNTFIPRPQTTLQKVAQGADSLLMGGAMEGPSEVGQLSRFGGATDTPVPANFSSKVGTGLTPAQAQAAARGERLGMRLTPGQRLGSKPLQQLEAWAVSHPWTSGPFNALARGNQSALNSVAANAIGETGDSVDASVLSRANERMGDIFNRVRTPEVALDVAPDRTLDFVKQLDEENEGLLPNDANVSSHPLVRTLTGLMKRAAGRAANRDAFMSDYAKMAPEGNLNGTSTWVEPSEVDPNAAHVEFIGRGEGGRFGLRKLLALADQHGVPLTATASAVGKDGIPTQDLMQHYAAAGFKPTEDGFLRRDPQVTAKQLGQLSSKLGRAAYKQMTSANGDRDLGKALFGVKDHVDDLLESNLTPEGKAAYSKARGEYRSLMQLVSRQNIVNPSTGNVSGAALANRLQQADRGGFLFGKNQTPLYNAARFAQAFKPIVGDSGTATRMANPFDPLELAMGVPANIAARAYLSKSGGLLAHGLLKGVPNLGRGLLSNPVVLSALSRAARP